MEKIANVINTVIEELTTKKKTGENMDPGVWLKKSLTKKELGHIKFHYFRKDVLGVRVDSSAWMYSLSLKKEALLNKIKEYNPKVKAIHFSIGDIR